MSDKRMLILPAEVVKKIDENRGDLSQAEFVDFLIENQFKESKSGVGVSHDEMESLRKELKDIVLREKKMATKDELQALNEDTRKLLKSFVDFFMSYGLELGEKSPAIDLKDITGKLKELEKDMPQEEGREVKIKWK
jgi:hypothetical protein